MRPCLSISVLVGCLSILAPAQTWPASQPSSPVNRGNSEDAVDPDALMHGVARLSLMNGGVSVTHGNMGEMAAGVLNSPLLTEDRVVTTGNGRAEIQLDGANQVRIAGATEVRMGDLQYKRYQVQIAQGLITFRVLHDNDAVVEISTPSVSVRPLRQGTYRVSVNAEGLTEVTIRSGDAEISSPTGTEPLRAGQTLLSRGNPSDPEFRTANMPAPDEWDRWNTERDHYFESPLNQGQNLSPDLYGTEDLNAYGRWTNDPSYGNVWIPNQGPDWAPYQDGRWSYLDYYGWTWIGYEPWGWVPYHYGRWYRGSFGWAWYPGAFGARHSWSPALVGFFGWGYPGFGASFGFGNIGWVPLAPYEAYRPWYGRGTRGTSFVANIGIAENFRNARINGAITGVRAGDFGRSAVNGSSLLRPNASDISHASMFSGGGPPAGMSVNAGRGTGISGTQGAAPGMSRSNTRFYSSPTFAGTRSPGFSNGFNNGVSNGSPAGTPNTGGWRRIDPATSGVSRAPNVPSGGQGFGNGLGTGVGNGFNSAPAVRAQGFQNPSAAFGTGSQPVRIAPPMINNRASFGPAAGPAPAPGGFGSPRPSMGPSGGFSRPSAPQGGGMRSAPSGARSSGGGRSSHR